MYYKQIENNIILSIGTLEVANDSLTEITETEYNNLLAIMKNARGSRIWLSLISRNTTV